MQTFLVLLLDKMQGDVLKGKDGMELMITSFSGAIPIEPKHIIFWKNVINLSFRKLRYNVVARTHTHLCACTYVYACMCVCVRACVHACVRACMRACVCAICMCEYVSHT